MYLNYRQLQANMATLLPKLLVSTTKLPPRLVLKGAPRSNQTVLHRITQKPIEFEMF
jgi:hypothetical protein